MKIHKESISVFRKFLIVFVLHMLMFYLLQVKLYVYFMFSGTFFLLSLFVLFFFRFPKKNLQLFDDKFVSPADGEIVVIEQIDDKEYFMDKRIQISVFMSVWNVHINWFPVKGKVVFKKYYPGKFLLARNPKSSLLNERNSVVVETDNGVQVLFRQIAGAVARRIVSYAVPGMKVTEPAQAGFIKFGSRVDLILPYDAKVLVQLGQKVKGGETLLAELNKE